MGKYKKLPWPKSIRKEEFIKQVAKKAGKTFEETQVFVDAMEVVVRDQVVNNGCVAIPGLLKIQKVILPAKPERQLSCFDGKMRTYRAKPARNVVRMKPLRLLREAVEGSDGTSS